MPRAIADDRILDAVAATVAARGYAGATTREIAAAAGINEVTLFRRFGSKASLIREALVRELAPFTAGPGLVASDDLEGDLVRVIELYRAVLRRRGPLVAVLLGEAPRVPELRPTIAAMQAMIRAIADLVVSHQRRGALVDEPPLQAIAALLGPSLLSGLLAPLDLPLVPPETPAREQVRLFLAGRRAPDPAR